VPRPAANRCLQASAAAWLTACIPAEAQQRHSQIPELSCALNSSRLLLFLTYFHVGSNNGVIPAPRVGDRQTNGSEDITHVNSGGRNKCLLAIFELLDLIETLLNN